MSQRERLSSILFPTPSSPPSSDSDCKSRCLPLRLSSGICHWLHWELCGLRFLPIVIVDNKIVNIEETVGLEFGEGDSEVIIKCEYILPHGYRTQVDSHVCDRRR